MKKIVFLLIPLLISCEDVIDLEVKKGKPQLVVDAWITDEVKEQSIKLSLSQAYFNQDKSTPALGAEVYVIRQDSSLYKFTDKSNTGNYTFTPKNKNYLTVNQLVYLAIKYKEQQYVAVSLLKRVPPIDSVKYQKINIPVQAGNNRKTGYLAQFFATDFKGDGDTYVVRSYKNDTLQSKSTDYTLVYDAGFVPGSNTDGLVFLEGVRMGINNGLWQDKDKATIELLSIPIDAYYFFTQLRNATSNTGIFATTASNLPTNIKNASSTSQEKAVGYFIVSKQNRYITTIDKDQAEIPK